MTDRKFEQQQILEVAKRLWSRASRLELSPACNYPQWYQVITDSGNVVALAFLDPGNFMPWFQPTGSTEPDECGG